MTIRIRSIELLVDFDHLKIDMGGASNDQALRELISWYRHTKLNDKSVFPGVERRNAKGDQ